MFNIQGHLTPGEMCWKHVLKIKMCNWLEY